MRLQLIAFGVFLFAPAIAAAISDPPSPFVSHRPARPLPQASERPLEEGPAYFVHPVGGNDASDGSQEKPWRTIGYAVTKLKPGDTLVLRGGTYYEHVAAALAGTPEKPITIRAYPGEVAILDGGLWDFQNLQSAAPWEVCPGGAPGEYRSTRAYPELKIVGDGPAVFGSFGDSLVPLQAYRFHGDLRSDNPYWNVENKVGDESFVYCGPGVFYDGETGRIHCRLAHTKLPGLGNDNYRGETDPRKVPLIIAGGEDPPLALVGCQNVRLQDLVLRGSRTATLQIHDCRNIELDGLTAYGGHSAMQVRDTWGLRMQHCACRGIGAPWTFRGMLKYRSVEARIFNASHWDPTGRDNRDFEIRYCEFTDSVDGVFLGNTRGVRFHHNLVENVTDDGVFLTAGTAYDGETWGGDMQFYQNRFARILTTFAFGVGHGRQKMTAKGRQTGSGAYIYRNVFDFRRPVWYTWPSGPDAPQEITSRGRFASDHGGPTWEPMWIYHNTILAGDTPRYDYGCDGLIHGVVPGTSRRVFNNIVVLTQGIPGTTLPEKPDVDFQGDGNLFWSLNARGPLPEKPYARFRASPRYEASKKDYAPGWTTNDVWADPRLAQLASNWQLETDLRPGKGSPAIDAGVQLANKWPDTLKMADGDAPDVGALPEGVSAWRLGVQGRLDASGQDVAANSPAIGGDPWTFAPHTPRDDSTMPRASIVEGYPAFDSPIAAYLLRKAGWQVEISERAWFDTAKLKDYQLVVYDGSLARAGLERTAFDEAEAANVRAYLESGGTLVLTRERHDLFRSDAGRKLLAEVMGEGKREAKPQIAILQPDHPWLAPLKTPLARASALPVFRFPDEKQKAPPPAAALDPFPWLAKGTAILTSKGQSLIGSPGGTSLLHRAPLGRGQLIYIGWSPAASIPHGREKSTVEEETIFEQQVAVLRNVLKSAGK